MLWSVDITTFMTLNPCILLDRASILLISRWSSSFHLTQYHPGITFCLLSPPPNLQKISPGFRIKSKFLRAWPLRLLETPHQPVFPVLKPCTPFSRSCPWFKLNACFYLCTSYLFPALCLCASCGWWWPSPSSHIPKSCWASRSLVVLSFMVVSPSTWALSPSPLLCSNLEGHFCISVLLHDLSPCLMLINIHYFYSELISLLRKMINRAGFLFHFLNSQSACKCKSGRMLQHWRN